MTRISIAVFCVLSFLFAPVIAGGKVFVATNNAKPRDPKIKGDKAVLMCFDETDGRFLWQLVHDSPTGGQGNCSNPDIS